MKNLIKNRRSGGWNLIEIIVAVAIGASIAAAGVVAYQGEAKKASIAKAKQFISQVETKKASIMSDVVTGAITAPPAGTSLDTLVLTAMKVNGTPLTGATSAGAPASADAKTLGFSAITVGALDSLDANGNVTGTTKPASVTLNGGTIITGGGAASGGTY